jgi:hypothetical protein
MLSISTKRDLVARYQLEYKGAGRKAKSGILDALCQATGWNRKYAVGRLAKPLPPRQKVRRNRSRIYGVNEEAALVKVWILSEFLTGKRLAPFIEEFVEALERHGEISLPAPVRSKLLRMSAATMDRLLRRHRHVRGKGVCATKPGGLLKSQVAIRLANGWDDSRPGFGEIDCVAHCGERFEGEFFHTLGYTDVATGWSEFRTLRAKGQKETLTALQSICKSLPFHVLGLDSDNGSEFLNWHLVNFCAEGNIQFTRCRPYHKNDQCRIEQKNGAIVRRHLGYKRYDTDRELKLMNRAYSLLKYLVNFFEPSAKGKEKAMTPYRRLLASGILGQKAQAELEEIYYALNPVQLRRDLLKIKMELGEFENLVRFLDEAPV